MDKNSIKNSILLKSILHRHRIHFLIHSSRIWYNQLSSHTHALSLIIQKSDCDFYKNTEGKEGRERRKATKSIFYFEQPDYSGAIRVIIIINK